MGRARSLGSTQQSVCLSCHDGHLSCPQSVWEEFFFPLERRGERGRERRREERNRKGRRRRRGLGDGKGRSLWDDGRRKEKMEGGEGL